jgi:predicted nucleic acid-binding Zn ribbon protein
LTTKRSIGNAVASFCELPRDGSFSLVNRIKSAGHLVALLIKKHRTTVASPQRLIHENWETIVGSQFHSHCQPEKILTNDVLIVRCPNSIIRAELLIKKPKILEKLRKFSCCEKISDIRFIANR